MQDPLKALAHQVRVDTIKECIAYLESRPGLHAARALRVLLRTVEYKAVLDQTPVHPWRKTLKEQK